GPMTGPVLVLGGGVTGMHVATALAQLGHPTVLLEKAASLGGRVPRLSRTFPFFNDDGFNDGAEFANEVEADMKRYQCVDVRLGTTLVGVEGEFPEFRATLSDRTCETVSAIVVATGFEPFDPTDLEEYGYSRYSNVVTAPELEWLLNPRGPTKGEPKRPSDGKLVERLAIVFCVGSRNRRIGAPFCSRICCSYSTKQALTVFDRNPQANITCFYMDVRTYDRGFEEMYSLAQDRGIRYIRGRVSGCKELPGGDILVRAENTLVQKIFSDRFDMVSLSTGMRPCLDVAQLAQALQVELAPDGFFASREWFRFPHDSTREGVLIAGCAAGVKPIRNCITDANAVAARVAGLLHEHTASPPALLGK
ncbi:MAG TPA: FAD-dependent oxidoreductase, partial [Acidimicrobiales bacterium]|nr:FAD-dependent oxidoreductase [Acidimicrobiales bacterium]